MALTPKQIENLQQLTGGADSIPTINAGKLAAAGLVEKTGESSRGRGFSHCRITDAGLKELKEARKEAA